MKSSVFQIALCITLVLTLILSMIPADVAHAAYCYGPSCNWIDPYGKDCWNDAYNANIKYAGSIYNANKYSPGCVANWSYTRDTSATYLAAETVGVYTYHGAAPYVWVWNNMWDGTGTVCTKGYKGSSYMNYSVQTAQGCA
jgi:hypothetical protein